MISTNRYKKVLLIVPPFYRLFGGRNNWLHLGLSYIAGVLDTNGIFVRIYNTDYSDIERDVDLQDIFKRYDEFTGVINNKEHPIWKEIGDKIREFNPDLVGITLVFSVTVKSAINIAKLIKEINSNIKVVVGGPHATLLSNETLSIKEFDYLIRGEGEYTMLELISNKKLNEIDGLSYKIDGVIYHNKDRELNTELDKLTYPNPELQLIPIKDLKNNFGIIATSRGCNRRCVFCSSPRLWKRKVRFRSISNVIGEILYRKNRYNVTKFYFSDDSFNANIFRGKSLCKSIISNHLNIEYFCEANIKPFDVELAHLLKESGCIRVKLGMESGNDRILKLMKKDITSNDILKTCNLLKKYRIPMTLYIMIGMISETIEEIEDTYNLVKSINPDYVSLSIATPQIGSELGEMAEKEEIRLISNYWESYFHQSMKSVLNNNITNEIVEKFLLLNKKYENLPPYELSLGD